MTLRMSYSFEDTISETKFGKFNYIMITLSGLILACSCLESYCISLIIPIAQCELEMNNFHKGLLGSIGYLGIILSSNFWGFMADTKGRKQIMVPALILSFSFTILSTLVGNFWLLVILRFLNGFCICAPQGIIYAFLGEFHSSKLRAKVLIIASVLYGIFCLIEPLNGIIFLNQDVWNFYIPILNLNYNGWRIFLIMCSFPNIICAILMIYLIPESPKFTFSQGDEERTLKILQRIYKFNTGKDDYKVTSLIKDKEFEEGKSEQSKGFIEFLWSQTIPLFKQPHLKNTLTACYLQFGICLACNGFYTFFPDIVNKVTVWLETTTTPYPHTGETVCSILSTYNLNSTMTEYVTDKVPDACVTKLELETFADVTILSILYTLGWLIISIVIDKVGKLVVLVFVSFSCGFASLAVMLLQFPHAALHIYLILLMAGLNMSVVNTSTIELFPTNLRAMAVSISMMVGRIGSVAGSNFVGLAIKNYCTYTWILPAVLLITGGFLAFTIPNINKNSKDGDKKSAKEKEAEAEEEIAL
ncbi:hypothetical protein PVAND_012394 [Polypedilum vanderplanki]|uniref:Major facilitator superfamily (MFS) profile domain-containing protein n=1 Tax=Polypedilum vanderplanki TaxID=319348 RepID=A0A9J6CN92_POLVA|nr:hypothetical protein PVAND_012394 [Polypedilum vanderplanki]